MPAPPYGRFVAVADNIRSLHNVGALFRSADGAGVTHLFLTGYSSYPPRPEIAKVALGAELTVPWRHAWHLSPLLDELQSAGYRLAALETTPAAAALDRYVPRWPLALLIGNEVTGVSPLGLERAQDHVRIPMRGAKASLNVSVAFGIAVYRLAESLPPECGL